MADKPCETCLYYDPIIRGMRPGRHGRCAMKSTYPAAQQPGQVFPPGVKRAEPGELAKPLIVVGKEVASNCSVYRAKPVKGGSR